MCRLVRGAHDRRSPHDSTPLPPDFTPKSVATLMIKWLEMQGRMQGSILLTQVDGWLIYHTGRCRCEIIHPYDSRYAYFWDYLALGILCKMKDQVTSDLNTKMTNSVNFCTIEIKQNEECTVYNWLCWYAIQVSVPSRRVLQLDQRKWPILSKVE